MKSFTDLAKHLQDQGPRSAVREPSSAPRGLMKSSVAEMASKLSLEEPVICRGVVETVHKGGSAFAVLGSGQSVFITRSIAKRLDLVEGEVLEMTVVGNYKDSMTASVPFRALFAVRSTEPLRVEEPAPAPAPTPELVLTPEPAPTKRMTFKEEIAAGMLAVMKPGVLYSASGFAFLTTPEKRGSLTAVLEALFLEGRVQRISLHSSPTKRAGRLYWCLPDEGKALLDGMCEDDLDD